MSLVSHEFCSQFLLKSREKQAAANTELSGTCLGMQIMLPGKCISYPVGCPLPVLELWERPLKLFQENACSLALKEVAGPSLLSPARFLEGQVANRKPCLDALLAVQDCVWILCWGAQYPAAVPVLTERLPVGLGGDKANRPTAAVAVAVCASP